MQSRVLALPRAAKRLVVVASDVFLALLSTWLAYTLRLDTPHWPIAEQWYVYLIAPVLFIPVFFRFGLYRAIFRYTGQAALTATAKAVAVYGAVLSVILFTQRWPDVPRSLGILQPLIFFLLVGASRAFARFWLAGLALSGALPSGSFLIFGAGTAGVQTASALAVSGQFELVGFVDDDAFKVGRSINGVPVFAPQSIPDLVNRGLVTDILLALPSASRARRKEIIESLRSLPVHIRTLPDWADLASGRVTTQDFQELDIEDLLGRDPVPPNRDLLARNLVGKSVLVTGAAGSIGSELCRQIVQERPRQLLLLDHSEFGLYTIHQELLALAASRSPELELVPLLGSVTDATRLAEICHGYKPHTVYHAAAYKHVPLVESNPAQGIFNNVFGTLHTARAALASGVSNFVLVSTDKAVRPTNVMGASKRMAELVLQALATDAAQAGTTCFSMVRFGNVLDSSGSVVPLFRQQIASGGPLTVTHPEVTRYFMTISEAAQLVLQAAAMAGGGEVFVLDMGEPVKILDLARRMVELSGLQLRSADHPAGDIEIVITGLRLGEKLYEELLLGDNPIPTVHPRIMKAREEGLDWAALQPRLDALQRAVVQSDVDAIKAVLRQCVQGYVSSTI
ncbi:MAG: nucleoside-diphosphate sugar epimerase/dehydratase [Burkholderiales bacterium]|nr:nucleoside-diphosphate sugar epimerase/dehydratase [Burkholderiales bacterium]